MNNNESNTNIIIILADDLGYSDLGCYGSEIKTPNIDSLGNNGIKFSQFYNQARCSPSRASLMTGLTGHQAGVGQLSGDLGAPGYRGFINNECVTVAEVLKQKNYKLQKTLYRLSNHQMSKICNCAKSKHFYNP